MPDPAWVFHERMAMVGPERVETERELARILCGLPEPCVHCWSSARKVLAAEEKVRRWLNSRHNHSRLHADR